MKKRKAVIVDLDGTLVDSRHRAAYARDKRVYYALLPQDSIIEECAARVRAFRDNGCVILYVTARNVCCMEATKTFLAKHGLFEKGGGKYRLFCRAGNGDGDAVAFKRFVYLRFIRPVYEVEAAMDDDEAVTEMWREIGIKRAF